MTKTVALIPARSGSKGVPDKNIRLLGGQPLLAWSVRAAVLATSVQRVIVSTDSPDYARIARTHGAQAPFLRPEDASSDHAGDEAVAAHLVKWLQDEGQALPDHIVYLRPTTPLRDPDVIDAAVKALENNAAATSLRSIHQMAESAYKTFELRNGILASVGTGDTALDAASGPRQGFPETWIGNGYVDVFRSQRLTDGVPLYGDQVMGFVTETAPEIDTEEDFDYLEYQASRHSNVYNTLFNNNISTLKVS
jgi:CMP-N,N'-diacetyllegionaminic acid synthase